MCTLADLRRYGAAMEQWLAERAMVMRELRTTASMHKRSWLRWRAASAVNEEQVYSLRKELKEVEDRRPHLPRPAPPYFH